MPDIAAKTAHSAAGYETFTLGGFKFSRDENFAIIDWGTARHHIHIDLFLNALARDLGWRFLYGWIFFDDVFGTVNHYGTVEIFAGIHHPAYRDAGVSYMENFSTDDALTVFEAIVRNWVNAGFDPLSVPKETGTSVGPKGQSASTDLQRGFTTAPRRMLGLPDDVSPRSEAAGQPVNPSFSDLRLDQPDVHAEPGFEGKIHALSVFDHIARSEVTWIPSTTSITMNSIFCMSSEEHTLPVTHGNDRPEWFIQLTDEIHWQIQDKDSGAPRGRVIMRAGDVCAMPADIRHKGYAPKRAMLLVLENGSPELPALYAQGKLPPYPVEFS